MDRRVKASADLRWFAERTDSAPEVLRGRVEAVALATDGEDLVEWLADAGEVALSEAMSAGASRVAALDLLAADALITLALLAEAERAPAMLGSTAHALRIRAAS